MMDKKESLAEALARVTKERDEMKANWDEAEERYCDLLELDDKRRSLNGKLEARIDSLLEALDDCVKFEEYEGADAEVIEQKKMLISGTRHWLKTLAEERQS